MNWISYCTVECHTDKNNWMWKGKFHWLDSVVSWRPVSFAPSCWSPVAGQAPCSSPSGTLDYFRPPGRSTALCVGLWWEGEPSPLRHLSRRSSWAGLLRQRQMGYNGCSNNLSSFNAHHSGMISFFFFPQFSFFNLNLENSESGARLHHVLWNDILLSQ